MQRNSWTIMGHLGRDAQTAVTTGGKAVAKFAVAVNEGWKDTEGVWQERTTWVRVECWGSTYHYGGTLKEGQKVQVEGRYRKDAWVQDGKEREGCTLVARSILLLAKSDTSDIEGVGADDELPMPEGEMHTV
jgi:single-strand DNA-binding protein